MSRKRCTCSSHGPRSLTPFSSRCNQKSCPPASIFSLPGRAAQRSRSRAAASRARPSRGSLPIVTKLTPEGQASERLLEISHLQGKGNGEGRNRTADTTIFRRVFYRAEPSRPKALNPACHADSGLPHWGFYRTRRWLDSGGFRGVSGGFGRRDGVSSPNQSRKWLAEFEPISATASHLTMPLLRLTEALLSHLGTSCACQVLSSWVGRSSKCRVTPPTRPNRRVPSRRILQPQPAPARPTAPRLAVHLPSRLPAAQEDRGIPRSCHRKLPLGISLGR